MNHPLHLIIMLLVCSSPIAFARSFRTSRIPNGTVVSCASCHVNPSGAGTRTPFGQAVFTAIGGSSSDLAFWTPALATLDSDGDGRTNGDELNDPEGDFTTTGATGVTNPGNRPPVFSSQPPAVATRGLLLHYMARATDAESNAIVFTKTSGPSWLTVNTAGAVSGTPPTDAPTSITATIKVADTVTASRGNSRGFSEQTFALAIGSSFPGWQALNFTLPAESNIADAGADPDNDGIPNLEEYARRLLPKSSGEMPGLPILSGESVDIQLALRDDDPALLAVLMSSDTLDFANALQLNATLTDPVPDDGLKWWTFADRAGAGTARRFWRLEFRILP